MSNDKATDKEAAWRRAFADRLVERGLCRTFADACAAACDLDMLIDPADAADEEVSYWSDDGDE